VGFALAYTKDGKLGIIAGRRMGGTKLMTMNGSGNILVWFLAIVTCAIGCPLMFLAGFKSGWKEEDKRQREKRRKDYK
jgi:hypothetical protein